MRAARGGRDSLTEFSFQTWCCSLSRSAIMSSQGPTPDNGPREQVMRHVFLPWMGGLVLGVTILMSGSVNADLLKDEIARTGKLRVAIGISAAGGAYWSTKSENGYHGVPVDLGKALADQLGLPIEYVTYSNSGLITDAAAKGEWDVSFLPEDPERAKKIAFGPIYEVAEAPYIVKAGDRK